MDDKRKLSGHPWHVGYLKMDEDDTRRHKKRCRYFLRDESHKNYCQKISGNCFGSSHCPYYKESGAKKTTQEQSRNQVEEMLRKIFGE